MISYTYTLSTNDHVSERVSVDVTPDYTLNYVYTFGLSLCIKLLQGYKHIQFTDIYEVSECIPAPDGYILIQGIPFSDVDRNLLCTHLSTRSLVLEA